MRRAFADVEEIGTFDDDRVDAQLIPFWRIYVVHVRQLLMGCW